MRIVALAIVTLAGGCFFKPDPPVDMKPPGSGPVQAQFAVGDHHACQIDGQHQLWCWGDNRFGQLGVVTTDPYTGMPQQIPGTWRAVAAGRAHTCALDDNGTVQCWGANNAKQVAGGGSQQQLGITSVDFPPNKAPFNVFAGGDASCATMTDGELYCWGQYQLPDSVGFAVTPVSVGESLSSPPSGGWEQVAISDSHICVANDSDDVYCWGDNSGMELGDSTMQNHDVAHAYQYVDRMQHLSAGHIGTCGVSDAGQLECWGGNLIVNGGAPSAHAVIDPMARPDWKAVAVGVAHACAARGDSGLLFCWGADRLSELGDDFVGGAQLPNDDIVPGATEVYASQEWTCARKADHTTYCWGSNEFGEAGNGKVSTAHHPYKTLSGNIESIAAGPNHACAVLGVSGNVECWGTNEQQEITTASDPFYTSPTDTGHTAATDLHVRLVSVGGQHTCIRESSTTIDCWGQNAPAPTGPITPAAIGVTTSTTWSDFAAGGGSTCAAFDINGGAWCWGVLGDATGQPRQVENNGVAHVAVADAFVVSAGSSGNNTVFVDPAPQDCFPVNNPVGMDGMMVVRQVAAAAQGDGHACAEANDGAGTNTLYCWGHNDHNQCSSTASQCAGSTNTVTFPNSLQVKAWSDDARPAIISAGGNHTCAITENPQQLFCWGDNSTEALGETSFGLDTATSPTNVVNDSTMEWDEVATAASYTCALTKLHDAVYCWGLNERGQVGNGDRFPSAPPQQPVQIPGM